MARLFLLCRRIFGTTLFRSRPENSPSIKDLRQIPALFTVPTVEDGFEHVHVCGNLQLRRKGYFPAAGRVTKNANADTLLTKEYRKGRTLYG